MNYGVFRADPPPVQWRPTVPIPAQGTQPGPVGPLSVQEVAAVGSTWPPVWWAPPPPVTVAPLTLTYGDKPPVAGAVLPQELALVVGAWPAPWWPAPAAPRSAWNVPATTGDDRTGNDWMSAFQPFSGFTR